MRALLVWLLLALPLAGAKPDATSGVGGLPDNNTTATTPAGHAVPGEWALLVIAGGVGVALVGRNGRVA